VVKGSNARITTRHRYWGWCIRYEPAVELLRRGWKVSLFDPGPIPHPLAATTDISKILRMDYGADEDYMILMEQAFEAWDAWNQVWDKPLWHQTGFVIMTREQMKPGTFEYESYRLLQKRGHNVERLDAERLKRLFPAWKAENYSDGYFNPRAGWAESGAYSNGFLRRRKAGVKYMSGKILRLLDNDSRHWNTNGRR
jgi:glycine/D-amino acid oxidase-like deaminating enzyme